MKIYLQALYHFFISLKLAVITLSSLAVLVACGTFVESRYNQEIANKVIYHSPLMFLFLTLLSVNLTFVLIDRWPWKKKHAPFVLAHIGILTMILGSVMTKYLGIDAVLSFQEGESKSSVQLIEKEINIYTSQNGSDFVLLYKQDVDFFFKRPSGKKPFSISFKEGDFEIRKYIPYGRARLNYKKSKYGEEPALRFLLRGQMGSFSEWIQLSKSETNKSISVGPATITLTKDKKYRPKSRTELVLLVHNKKLFYILPFKKKKSLKRGQEFSTSWMDFKFRALEFFPQAQKEFLFESRKTPSNKTLEAIKVYFKGYESWIAENSYVRFYTKDQVYAFGYVNKSTPIGFDLKLLDFRVTNYQGSKKAKTYESEVELGGKIHVISMNEPLKHNGLTFYQSSFEEDEKGQPTISILSVNQDPGRALKYGGGLLISLGIILLFFRRKIKFFT